MFYWKRNKFWLLLVLTLSLAACTQSTDDGNGPKADLSGITPDKPWVASGEQVQIDLQGSAAAGESLSGAVSSILLEDKAGDFSKAVDFSVVDEDTVAFTVPPGTGSGAYDVVVEAAEETFIKAVHIPGSDLLEGEAMFVVNPGVQEAALASKLDGLGFDLTGFHALGSADSSSLCSGILTTVTYSESMGLSEAVRELSGALGAELFDLGKLANMPDGIPLNVIDPKSGYSVRDTGYLDDIGARIAQGRGLTGKGTTIAVLDTGVSTHTELTGRLLPGRDFVGNDGDASDEYDNPANEGVEGHGTAVAVLAAGADHGVAPEADILPVRVCDAGGKCDSSDVVRGMCYALNNSDVKPETLVMNLSLGGETPPFIPEFILFEAMQKNTLIAAAAGNRGDDNSPKHYPAAYNLRGVVVAAALNAANNGPADFSNAGTYIDIAAPGVGLESGMPNGESYTTYQGTSFATALTAGALALWREAKPGAAPDTIVQGVRDAAKELPGTSLEDVGRGMLDLSVQPEGTPGPDSTPPTITQFTANPTDVAVNTPVTFSWNVTEPDGDSVSCTLDFGDGSDAESIDNCLTTTVQHSYTSEDTFTATLTAEDKDGEVSRTTQITVREDTEDLPVTLTVNVLSDTIVSGGFAQYEVVISNPTGDTVSSLILEQTVLSDLFYPRGASDLDGGTRGTQVIEWNLGDLAAGNSITLKPIIDTLRLEDGTLLPSAFELDYAGPASPIKVDTEITVEETPVLELVVGSDRSLVSSGDAVTYTLDYSNVSTNINATDSTLTASIPSGTTFVSATDGGTNAGSTVSWDLDVLSPREVGQVQFTVTIEALPQGSVFTTDATLASSEETALEARASAVNILEDEDPLAVIVNVLSDTITSGGFTQYEVIISNPTSDTVSSIILEQTVLSDLFYPRGASDLDGGTRGSQTIQWDLGNLAAGDSVVLKPIIDTLRWEDGTLLPSTFELAYAGTSSALRVDTAIVVEEEPVIELLANTGRSLVSGGDTITYTLHYANQSSGANATDSILNATIPAGTTFTSATDGGTNAGGTVSWNLDVLSPGEYGQVQFTVTVEALPQGSSFTTNVELTSNDSAILTARASASNVVEDEDPLDITIEVLSETIVSGGFAQYEVVISNPTSDTVSSIILEQTVLSDLFYPRGASDLDGAIRGSQILQWDLGDLTAGDSITLRPVIDTLRWEDGTLLPSTFELNYAGTTSAIQVDTAIVVDDTP